MTTKRCLIAAVRLDDANGGEPPKSQSVPIKTQFRPNPQTDVPATSTVCRVLRAAASIFPGVGRRSVLQARKNASCRLFLALSTAYSLRRVCSPTDTPRGLVRGYRSAGPVASRYRHFRAKYPDPQFDRVKLAIGGRCDGGMFANVQ